MSFYEESSPVHPSQQSQSQLSQSQSNNNTQPSETCPNCGSTSFYPDDISGVLICSECHTQSQTQTLNEVELQETDIFHVAGGAKTYRKSFRGKVHKAALEDKSVPPPDLDACMEGMTFVMKLMGRRVARLVHVEEEKLLLVMRGIWLGYLNSWSGGAEYYSRRRGMGGVRFSLRDAFLQHSKRNYLVNFLEERILKQMKDDGDDVDSVDPRRRGRKRKRPIGSSGSDDTADNNDSDSSQHPGGDDEEDDEVRFGQYRYRHRFPHAHQALDCLHKKGPVSPIEAALRLRPSLLLILSIIHASLLHFKAGVTSSHLVNWVLSNDIPYVNVFVHLPPRLKDKLVTLHRFFSSRSLPDPYIIDHYSELVGIASGVPYPSHVIGTVDNAPLVLSRFAADLNIPQRVLNTALSLMGVECRSDDGNESVVETTMAAPPLKNARLTRLPTPAHVLAVLIVAIKFTPRWESWQVRCLPCRDGGGAGAGGGTAATKFVVPWKESSFRALKNGQVGKYLDFVDETFFKELKSTHKNYTTLIGDLERRAAECATTGRLKLDSSSEDEDDSDDDCVARRAKSRKGRIQPNAVIAGYPNPNNKSRAVAAAIPTQPNNNGNNSNCPPQPHRYLSYYPEQTNTTYPSPRPYHPHYGLLIEFISTRFHVDSSWLENLVARIDGEVVKLGLDVENAKGGKFRSRHEEKRHEKYYNNGRKKKRLSQQMAKEGNRSEDDDCAAVSSMESESGDGSVSDISTEAI